MSESAKEGADEERDEQVDEGGAAGGVLGAAGSKKPERVASGANLLAWMAPMTLARRRRGPARESREYASMDRSSARTW